MTFDLGCSKDTTEHEHIVLHNMKSKDPRGQDFRVEQAPQKSTADGIQMGSFSVLAGRAKAANPFSAAASFQPLLIPI